MEYRTLGRSGCAVSALALGTMTFGNTTDEEGAFAQLDAFTAAGGTLVDTADVYVDGASETIIGRWLSARPSEHVVVATKGRFPTSAEPNGAGASRRHLDRALTASLRRLRVDTIDLYQIHAWDPLTPVEETLSFLDDAVRDGRIRYGGLSNYLGWQIQRTMNAARHAGLNAPVTLQTGYSLLSREIEWEIAPACESTGLGLLTYSPLGAGILTGKYQRPAAAVANTRMADPRMGPYLHGRTSEPRTVAVLDALGTIAGNRGVPIAHVALAWLLARPLVSSVVLGARTLDQLTANLDVSIRLTSEEHSTLDTVSVPEVDFPYGGTAVSQFARPVAGGWAH